MVDLRRNAPYIDIEQWCYCGCEPAVGCLLKIGLGMDVFGGHGRKVSWLRLCVGGHGRKVSLLWFCLGDCSRKVSVWWLCVDGHG